MHEITELGRKIQCFEIYEKERNSSPEEDLYTYEVFDQNQNLNYEIKVRCEGLFQKRSVTVNDAKGYKLTTITSNRRGCFNKVELSEGDDGCLYNRRTHLLSKDQYSFEVSINSKKEKFNFQHECEGFTGFIYNDSTSQVVATIIESEESEVFFKHDFKLETNQVVPIENLLGFLGLIIAAREEDRRIEEQVGIAFMSHHSFESGLN